MDYVRAPELSYFEIRKSTEAAFKWLKQSVGVDNKIIVMGESAGANLAYQLLTRAPSISKRDVLATVLSSPWIELSASFPSREEVHHLSQTKDILSVNSVMAAGNLALFGVDDPSRDEDPLKRTADVSPFFTQDFKPIPKPMVLYSLHEMMGPSITNWIQRWSATQEVVTVGRPNTLHAATFISILMTIRGFALCKLGKLCLDDIDEIAEHCLQAYEESLPNSAPSIKESKKLKAITVNMM
jgi:acetyl esterase/lipase